MPVQKSPVKKTMSKPATKKSPIKKTMTKSAPRKTSGKSMSASKKAAIGTGVGVGVAVAGAGLLAYYKRKELMNRISKIKGVSQQMVQNSSFIDRIQKQLVKAREYIKTLLSRKSITPQQAESVEEKVLKQLVEQEMTGEGSSSM